jgi:prepilin-type N-terminal cleavage/methylation domain-containing protein
MRNKQTGFTLVDLVVVIVILGILAATALPRFNI